MGNAERHKGILKPRATRKKASTAVLAFSAACGVALVVFLLFAGTYVAYFIAAMQRPPKSPFVVTCTRLAAPRRNAVPVRFDITNRSGKDATWMNFALFASGAGGRNLSDWGYVLKARAPARGHVSEIADVPLPSDYRTIRFSSVQCNVINAVFADRSQESYGGGTDTFP